MLAFKEKEAEIVLPHRNYFTSISTPIIENCLITRTYICEFLVIYRVKNDIKYINKFTE